MNRTVISIEHVWKQYRLGLVGTGSLGNDLKRSWYRIRGKEDPFLKLGETNDRTKKGESDYVWALEDISFDVKEGEVVGIVGKNGAGKSTLLKILSRVTTPSKGLMKVRGRIASLLEVGTGFHPDLSGRENIFLNGTILGMRRSEIRERFDEIVAFSGVERYIDTPVKRYSSGMYVRLAFAVAAHLEPEILIVDEVLAVGDAEFQRKCLGKMKDASEKGRTVLFVSHNMAAVRTLCTRGILLENGRLAFNGDVNGVVDKYLQSMSGALQESGAFVQWNDANAPRSAAFSFQSVCLKNRKGEITGTMYTNEEIAIEIAYEVIEKISGSRLAVQLTDHQGTVVFLSTNQLTEMVDKEKGHYISRCIIPGDLLNGAKYYVSVNIGKPHMAELMVRAENVVSFDTILMGNNGSISRVQWPGLIAPRLKWETELASRDLPVK